MYQLATCHECQKNIYFSFSCNEFQMNFHISVLTDDQNFKMPKTGKKLKINGAKFFVTVCTDLSAIRLDVATLHCEMNRFLWCLTSVQNNAMVFNPAWLKRTVHLVGLFFSSLIFYESFIAIHLLIIVTLENWWHASTTHV